MRFQVALNQLLQNLNDCGISVQAPSLKMPVFGPYLITGTWKFNGIDTLAPAIVKAFMGLQFTRVGGIESLKFMVTVEDCKFIMWFKQCGGIEIEPQLPTTERPVTCLICGDKMYYHSDPNWEPEASIVFSRQENRDDEYVHVRCLNQISGKVL